MTSLNYHVKPILVECKDNAKICGTLFSPPTKNPNGIVIICAAIGVGQAFYHEFAAYLCQQKFSVITFDFRGTGDSKNASPHRELKLCHWATRDIDAVISHALTLPGSDHIFLAGHSVGGQIFCLAEHAEKLSGAILIAASFPYWKRWPFPQKWSMYFFFHILIRILSIGRKRFPTKMLGLAKENIPVNLVRDWGRWARHPDYVTAGKFKIDTTRFNTIDIPMLSFSFDDDTYAPQSAVRKLHTAFSRTTVGEVHIATKQRDTGGIGHFGFFKKNKARDLWENTIAWMDLKKSI